MQRPVFRVPGQCSGKSLKYISDLTEAGWPSDVLESLTTELPRFEAASTTKSYEESLLVFMEPPHELHTPFLKSLNIFIHALDSATRTQELQIKATSDHKDSIVASELLARITGQLPEQGTNEEGSNSKTTIQFNVKPAKAKVKVTKGKKVVNVK